MSVERKETRDLLVESLRDLTASKTINKIYVAEIARNCSLSSSTFYHYFNDKYELISTVINEQIDKKLSEDDCDGIDHFFSCLFDVMDEDRVFYANVISNMEYDYPNHAFFHVTLDSKIRNIIVEKCMKEKPGGHTELLLQVYLAGITAALCSHTISRPRKKDDLMRAFVDTIPMTLQPMMRISMETDAGE